MLIATAPKAMSVNKIPAIIRQGFKFLFLRLLSVPFTLEFLQLKVIIIGMLKYVSTYLEDDFSCSLGIDCFIFF